MRTGGKTVFKENSETLNAQFFEADKLPELSFERNTPIRSNCVSRQIHVKYSKDL